MADIWGSTDHSMVEVKIVWWVGWRDANRNVTNVAADLYARRKNTGWTTYGTFNGGVSINGVRTDFNRQLSLGPGQDWVYVGRASTDVWHNADGNKQCNISAYGGIPGTGWNTTWCSADPWLDRLITAPPKAQSVSASRSADNRVVLTIRYSGENARNGATYICVDRQRVSNPRQGYGQIMKPGGKPTSLTDSGVSANAAYQYALGVYNGAGTSGAIYSNVVYTTPAAPSSVTAVKNPDLSITVTWTNNAAYTPGKFIIYDGDAEVGSVAGSVTTWKHAKPDSGKTHTYTVKAVAPDGSVTSAASAPSPTVLLLAPPNAPTNLSPNGTYSPLGADMVLRWQHNPVDTTEQTEYFIRYRKQGSSNWEFTTFGGRSNSFAMRFPGVGRYEWQVQTKGQHASFSPFSDVAVVRVATAPTVTISSPTDPWNSSISTVRWAWKQAEKIQQTDWTVELRKGGEVIESRTGTGGVTAIHQNTRLDDKTTYTVTVTASAGNGELKASAEKTFTTSFPSPSAPGLDGVWHPDEGAIYLTLYARDGTPKTESIELERSIDGGTTWETMIPRGTGIGRMVTDYECLTYGDTMYRATAWSNLPSSATTTITVHADSTCAYLSGGAGFSHVVALPYNLDISITASRERDAITYDGRSLPVAYSGTHISREVSCSGRFLIPSHGLPVRDKGMSIQQLVAVAQVPEPIHLFRDPEGNRIYGTLSSVKISRPAPAGRDASFSLVETGRE